MKVFINKTFRGYNPIGCVAVIVSENNVEAAKILWEKLIEIGLPQKVHPSDMIEISTNISGIYVLNDGNY